MVLIGHSILQSKSGLEGYFPNHGLFKKANHVNALQEVFDTSRDMFIVAMLGTFLGYWFIVFLIKKLGRWVIQLVGFLMMSICMLFMGLKYDYLKKWKFVQVVIRANIFLCKFWT